LTLDLEIHHHLGSFKHVINIIMWIRDTGCYGRPPLEDNTGGEKMILDKFEDLTHIDGGRAEHLRMGGNHGEEVRNWAQSESQEQWKARIRKRWWLSVLGFENKP
jgi:hypothetical protein